MLNNINLNHIRETRWYRQGGDGALFYFYTPFTAAMFWFGADNIILQQEGKKHRGFFNMDIEYQKALEDIAAQKEDKNYIDSLIGRWEKIGREMDEYLSVVPFGSLSNLSDGELLAKFKRLRDLDFELWKIGIHIEIFDPWSEKIITETMREYNLSLNKSEIDELVSPNILLYSQTEELELYKIYLDGTDPAEKMKAQQRKYFWLENTWAEVKILGVEYFAERLNKLSELGRKEIENRVRTLEESPVEKSRRKEEIIARHNIPAAARNIFYFFSRMAEWRDERKKAALIYNNYYYLFAEEFCRRAGVPFALIIFARPEEIINSGLKFSPEFVDHLKARSERSAYHADTNGQPITLINDEYRAFMEVLDDVFKKQFKEIKGVPASKGRARGEAKIINVSADFGKMRAGDILVAPMTRPDYLPLMKIAAAIVTDEGGVTCHAAIISRELGIPCVIGTQVATDALKDGDLVEVDATRGVVRKIK